MISHEMIQIKIAVMVQASSLQNSSGKLKVKQDRGGIKYDLLALHEPDGPWYGRLHHASITKSRSHESLDALWGEGVPASVFRSY